MAVYTLFECGMIVEGAVIEGFLPLLLAREKRCVCTRALYLKGYILCPLQCGHVCPSHHSCFDGYMHYAGCE